MRVIELGLMTEQGQAAIELAKAAGTWDAAVDRWAELIQSMVLIWRRPDDAFRANLDSTSW
jgi:hypothetical protein